MSIAGMLGQVSALRRTQEKLALLSGENFNIFRILRLESREVRTHSAFLGELLNPAGSHGLRDVFLKLFTEAIGFEGFQTDTARLSIEQDIGRITTDYLEGGRIDIYLESAGQYIFIENKIYASDQQNQLGRYHAHRNDARLLYLTLGGEKPTEWGSGELKPEQYQLISYRTDIAGWLEKCRQAAAAYPLVRETIVQYQHLINSLTGNTPNDFMKEEMKHLLQGSQENFVSASALIPVFEETRQEFIKSLVDEFETVWNSQFEQNLSPLSGYEIHFRLQGNNYNNIYGFRVSKGGNDVMVLEEQELSNLLALTLNNPKIKRQKGWRDWDSWLGWKFADSHCIDSLPLDELYQAATNREARERLFEAKIREATPYFEYFKALAHNISAVQ